MRVLCGTDLLPKTSSALDRAGMLARQLDAELTLLHVVPPTESERMLEHDVERAKERLESHARPPLWQHGHSPRVCVRTGSAARTLIAAARTLDVGLVVLGTHRARPARDALAGTLADRLLSKLMCPLLIVHRMPWHAYRNVLLALDCSSASGKAVRAAEALVLASGSRASVVHAYQPPYEATMVPAGIAGEVIEGDSTTCRQQSSTGLRDLLREVSSDVSRYDVILEDASTPEAIQRVVRRLNPELVILGTHGRGRWRRAFLGNLASRIMSSAKSDVLIVPDHPMPARWRNARSDRLSLDVVPGA